jgi:membrane glycosyltransferase
MTVTSEPTLWTIVFRRTLAVISTAIVSFYATFLFADFLAADAIDWLDIFRLALFSLCMFWLAWGSILPLFGLVGSFFEETPPRISGAPQGRTAILVPVYKEDAAGVFSRIAAMHDALTETVLAQNCDFFILSDSNNAESRLAEEKALVELRQRCQSTIRIFYRNRKNNIGKKAGNIADFVTTSGGAYPYMLVLDADSLIAAETIVEMVRRMEAAPNLGLLQTLPTIIGRRSLFGRSIQFASYFYAPMFARGLTVLQGREGPFWGHNALIRTKAFAQCCGLPKLPGKPPFGGEILSHDFVEAALLARGGWTVRLDVDLKQSYEEAPTNVIEFAKRDRRWCQGNLQHLRILPAKGLKFSHRINFFQGALGYLASPIWLLFLSASALAPVISTEPVYFPENGTLFPAIPPTMTSTAIMLIELTIALLLLPKLLIVLRSLVMGKTDQFGGLFNILKSVFGELFLSSLLAPIHMMFQSRSVMQVLAGLDAGWPATDREDGKLSFEEAFKATWWMSIVGIVGLVLFTFFTDISSLWALPICLPLILAPNLVKWTASPRIGLKAANYGLFQTPVELYTIPIIQSAYAHRASWPLLEITTPASQKGLVGTEASGAIPV